jgi:hypothetical protein
MAIDSLLIQDPTAPARAPTYNLSDDGPNGLISNPSKWNSFGNYIPNNLLAFLLKAPTGFQYMDDPIYAVRALKTLIETMPISIGGIDVSVNLETDGPLIGNDGQKFESATKSTREISEPNFTWVERKNLTITKYWTSFITDLISDPDTQLPAIISSAKFRAAQSPTILPDFNTFVTLFVEPDNTLTRVVSAALSANMMPKNGGPIKLSKELGGIGAIVDVPIPFTAYTKYNAAVMNLAQQMLNSLKIENMRPMDLLPAVSGVDVKVSDINSGLAAELISAVAKKS